MFQNHIPGILTLECSKPLDWLSVLRLLQRMYVKISICTKPLCIIVCTYHNSTPSLFCEQQCSYLNNFY